MSHTILIDHGSYALANLGDIAMLRVAVTRLAARLPGARILVPTCAPGRLARFCPGATPLSSDGLSALVRLGYLPGRYLLPGFITARLVRLERRLRGRRPEWLDALAMRRAVHHAKGHTVLEVLGALAQTELFVTSGGGFLSDAFPDKTVAALTLLHRAQRRQIPTALVSQGIGPLEDRARRRMASRVLSRAKVIAVRERCFGPSLLEALGVEASRVAAVGDDAVAAAYEKRRAAPGTALGINLRAASYSGLGPDELRHIGDVLRGIAAALPAKFVSIPIGLGGPDSDAASVARAVAPGEPLEAEPEDVEDAIALAGRCRVVVSASYHAAVFALAQGIPAVGISRTPYYSNKLLGLAELFGAGASVVRMDQEGWEARLREAIQENWTHAERLRDGLLAAAAAQIRSQEEVYARVAALAGSHRPATRVLERVEVTT